MKGYKGMDSQMRCRGMQYEVGKSYHVDGEIEICENGLHFCKNLNDVFRFYKREGNRFFEVEASGVVRTGISCKYATSDLMIVRELSDIEINRTVYGDGYGNGCGEGYGCGNGYGYGYGKGYCYNGDGYGYGYGDGYGYGYGDDYGDGYGYGNGDGIERILIFV